MKRSTKVWLIVAGALVVAGLAVIIVALAMNNWNLGRLSSVKYQTNSYEIKESFDKIEIISDTADIVFLPGADGECRVVCEEKEKELHTVNVEDGKLTIKLEDTRKWYNYITFLSIGSPKITVYLPSGEYGDLIIKESTGEVDIPKDYRFESIDISVSTGDVKCMASASELFKIKTSTGDIFVESVTAGEMILTVSTGKITASAISCVGNFKISVSTGKTNLENVRCADFKSKGTTGDITMNDVVATNMMNIERSTGDVKLEGCDAGEIYIKTDTGDVTGSLISEKIFFVNTDTGKKSVPQTMSGGKCEITCDTGDIIIKIQE